MTFKKLFLLLFFISTLAKAQNTSANYQIISYSKFDSIPTFLKFKLKDATLINSENINKWFNQNLKGNNEFKLIKKSSNTDLEGNYHEKYIQYYKQYRVVNSMVNVHFKNKVTQSINGHFFPQLNVNTTISLTENEALNMALSHYAANTIYEWELKNSPHKHTLPKGELCIVAKNFIHKKDNFFLAYEFEIHAAKPSFSEKIYIDAQTGKVLKNISIQCNEEVPSRGLSYFSGIKNFTCDSIAPDSILMQQNINKEIQIFDLKKKITTDEAEIYNLKSNYWKNDSLLVKNPAVDVYYGMEKTLDYFTNVLNRNSVDDMGYTIRAIVNYDTGFNNAFWNGLYAVFGNGDGITMNPLVTLDICGHELVHGVTGYSAGLVYSEESGALNESFSDIFGKCIEHTYQPNNFTWIIANKVMKNGNGFRDMKNPYTYGDPKYYNGLHYHTDPIDNYGVHTNSGIQNHWFYLLCEGGTEKNEKNNVTHKVDSIGWTKATRIAYNTLNNYLTDYSDYQEAANLSSDAAGLMYGWGSHEHNQVILAWHLAGLANLPTNIQQQSIAKNIYLFPNPAQNELIIKHPLIDENNMNFKVIDITGKTILSSKLDIKNTIINISEIVNGVYFLQFEDGSTLKFVKI